MCYRTGKQHLAEYLHPPKEQTSHEGGASDGEEIDQGGETEDEAEGPGNWGIHHSGSLSDIEQDEVANSVPFRDVVDDEDGEEMVKIKKSDWDKIQGVAKKLASEGRLEQLLNANHAGDAQEAEHDDETEGDEMSNWEKEGRK